MQVQKWSVICLPLPSNPSPKENEEDAEAKQVDWNKLQLY